MRTSLPSRSAPAYRQALRHPVFMQSTPEHDIVAVAQATLPPPVAPLGSPDLCSQERRAVLESMLRFFDVAHRCWADLAPAHAPELAIMADLYINEHLHRPVAVGDACIAARVPFTSALRAIDRLIAGGMVIRYGDPRDSRRKLLALTDVSRHLMAHFSDQIIRERPKDSA